MNDEQLDRFTQILGAAKDGIQTGRLNDWETKFIEDFQSKYEEYGADVRVSGRQWEILEKIMAKL